MRKNPVLVIAGPTASGKSALAAKAAHDLNGVVLNCDSMQIYKDIPIIAAAPTEAEKNWRNTVCLKFMIALNAAMWWIG